MSVCSFCGDTIEPIEAIAGVVDKQPITLPDRTGAKLCIDLHVNCLEPHKKRRHEAIVGELKEWTERRRKAAEAEQQHIRARLDAAGSRSGGS